ncbi:hypothetical protein [uncultured Granulicatella sp.]|uniref:hypothetical protein n=1 Tax=uncultured Granulicatella sp. TaxID=316089 RepID=UPI0028D8D354|nr:hypothetical protein [uncultured Granulicatella sp.]
MIELHTEEGTKLEIYDISCITRMREIYGGLKGEYTSLTLNGLPCSVTVLETKRQIEQMLQPEMDLFTAPKNDTDCIYRYIRKILYKKKDARYRNDLEYVEYEVVTATKKSRVEVKAYNGKMVDIADTYTVVRERKVAGKTVELEERYFIKTVGRGRYWK